MTTEVGIKETKELFKALGVLASTAGLVMKDKKVDFQDLQHLVALAVQFNTIKEGIQDIDKALEEMKDLEVTEVIDLVKEGFKVGDSYEEARKS